jgi:hypothetical protein
MENKISSAKEREKYKIKNALLGGKVRFSPTPLVDLFRALPAEGGQFSSRALYLAPLRHFSLFLLFRRHLITRCVVVVVVVSHTTTGGSLGVSILFDDLFILCVFVCSLFRESRKTKQK